MLALFVGVGALHVAAPPGAARHTPPSMVTASPASQLAQLAGMTTLSIDTGDLDVLKEFDDTGLITDATTNPLFVSQAGLSGDARYVAFVDAAIAYAKANANGPEEVLELSMVRRRRPLQPPRRARRDGRALPPKCARARRTGSRWSSGSRLSSWCRAT